LGACGQKSTQARQDRGSGEPGNRIDAASIVSGTRVTAETINDA